MFKKAAPRRSYDDIPEAARDTGTPAPARNATAVWAFLAGGAVVAVSTAAALLLAGGLPPRPLPSPSDAIAPSPAPTAEPAVRSDDTSDDTATVNVLGHLPYATAPDWTLTDVSGNPDAEPDERIYLRDAAAEAFLEMQTAARRDGIRLLPLSGFRTLEDQEKLFFDIKARRGQTAAERAIVSAPPGHSEHHTGYAIDIGDPRAPSTHVRESFEDTPTFAWLQENAARFHFELSFPRNNVQGITYEPWHWRYVGDRHSLETFYRAQQLPPPGATAPDRERD